MSLFYRPEQAEKQTIYSLHALYSSLPLVALRYTTNQAREAMVGVLPRVLMDFWRMSENSANLTVVITLKLVR